MRWPDGLDLGIRLGQAPCIKRDTPTASVFTSLFINRNQLHATIFKKIFMKTHFVSLI